MNIKPGDVVCLRPSSIEYYMSARNFWWELAGFGKAADLKIKVTKTIDGVIYGNQIGGNGRLRGANLGSYTLYMHVDKQHALISKIKYLYSKCPTTKHWARES